ncbi:MAG: DUF6478 family protein, partial [Pseudomonadota bacterium]
MPFGKGLFPFYPYPITDRNLSERIQAMLRRLRDYWHERQHRWALRRWEDGQRLARVASLSELRELRRKANQLRRRLDAVNHVAINRLTLPVIGSNAIRKPARTEWSHRPEAWAGPVV